MSTQLAPITWWEAEPVRLDWELRNMEAVAPDLLWQPELGAWTGLAPLWPFERAEPVDLAAFTVGQRLELAVIPASAHPATAPKLWPLDPMPTIDQCTRHRWHVNGDGSLCLFQGAVDWTGEEACAELVVKAAGWFLEYLLVDRGCVDAMTERGIVASAERDPLFTSCQPTDGAEP